MIAFGASFAKNLTLPAVIELTGDVGTGKTTFTRGLAQGLGIKTPVTSPSFTLSKRYAFSSPDGLPCELVHYDFYRLGDPGIMREELTETLSSPNSLVVVEWGGEIADLLPATTHRFTLRLNEDDTHEIIENSLASESLSPKENP